jgi:hypothetical protein
MDCHIFVLAYWVMKLFILPAYGPAGYVDLGFSPSAETFEKYWESLELGAEIGARYWKLMAFLFVASLNFRFLHPLLLSLLEQLAEIVL